MAKATTNPEFEEIKKLLLTGKIIIGTERTVDELKKGKIAKVYLSSNAPKSVREDIDHYAAINNTEKIELTIPNDELGTVCKKPFSVSVLSVPR